MEKKLELEKIIEKNNENEKDNDDIINMNKELINKITILKKEVEFSKNEMKKKDEKLKRYLNKFDEITSENVFNMAEIENLEEELLDKKNEIDIKTKKIRELTDKNNGLEQEMAQLKIYYENKNRNGKNINKINKSYMKDLNKNDSISEKIKKKKNQVKEDILEEKIKLEELSTEELHNKRNNLIKERNKIKALYDKLPIKLVSKEEIQQKAELENQLNKINNYLMKIRLQLKVNNQ